MRRTNCSIALGLALSLTLFAPGIASANRDFDDDLPPNTGGRSGGSRGCSSEVAVASTVPALILLAPARSSSPTISTHPTFAWFVRDAGSWPMEFRLYEYDRTSLETTLVAEITDEEFKSAQGIMTLSLSEELPPLTVGRQYLWQVELLCDRHRPSGNPFADAEIEVIDPPPMLDTQLVEAKDEFDRATVYEENDLWYEALATVLGDGSNTQMARLRSALFERVTLGELESEQFHQSRIHHIQR
ncbi:MAG: DUF928 domain-containing protein [Cyanobacteriota bacterium]|nr:DUF928 domain-containing protein [Cyanobacteriota bacterium]